jgi:hypothetical protein
MRWKCMTPAQRGAYWQLICWQMQAENGHLPADLGALSRMADIDLSSPDNNLVTEAFPIQDNGMRANNRALSEWGKRRGLIVKRQEIGRAGGVASGVARAKPIGQAIGSPNGKQKVEQLVNTSTSTNHSQNPESEEEPPVAPRKKKPRVLYRFDEFCAIYPDSRLNYTTKAENWWVKTVKQGDDALVESILSGTRQHVDATEEQFLPNCGKFLEGLVWQHPPVSRGNRAFDFDPAKLAAKLRQEDEEAEARRRQAHAAR